MHTLNCNDMHNKDNYHKMICWILIIQNRRSQGSQDVVKEFRRDCIQAPLNIFAPLHLQAITPHLKFA